MILAKIQNSLLIVLLFVLVAFFSLSSILVFAPAIEAQGAIPAGCPGGPAGPPAPGTVCPDASTEEPYGVPSDCSGGNISADVTDSGDENHCGILRYLVMIINVLSALAGIVIVGSIVVAGIQYSSAGNDPQKISAAKSRIRNAIIALLLFIFGYGMLNYLIPGGVF